MHCSEEGSFTSIVRQRIICGYGTIKSELVLEKANADEAREIEPSWILAFSGISFPLTVAGLETLLIYMYFHI